MSRESKGQGEMETRKEEDDAYIFTLFCHYSLRKFHFKYSIVFPYILINSHTLGCKQKITFPFTKLILILFIFIPFVLYLQGASTYIGVS